MGRGYREINLFAVLADDRTFFDSWSGGVEQDVSTAFTVVPMTHVAIFVTVRVAAVVVSDKEYGVVFHSRSLLNDFVDAGEIRICVCDFC